MRHQLLTMADGSRVGISVGGWGVPLVFFHGIGMDRRVYLRLLSRLPQLGFVVIALDAPGHGESSPPTKGSNSFAARMATTDAVLDALGIEGALLVGHSMGGRTAAEIAALRPHRALGTVLIDPAMGEAFDVSARERIRHPANVARGLLEGAFDTVRDRVGLSRAGVVRHFGMLSERALNTLTHPRDFFSAATAVASADHGTAALDQLRANEVPVVVIHGERDMIVPLAAAQNAAEVSGGTLVTLPAGYHSWVLSSPWTLVEILKHVAVRGHLGEGMRAAIVRRADAVGDFPIGRYLRPDAIIRRLAGPADVVGSAEPRDHRLYHDYRIWDRAPDQ